MSSTFNEVMCKRIVGKEMPGSIHKVTCEPFEFTIPESGETITREFRYEYSPVEVVDSVMNEVEVEDFELA